MSQSRVCTAVVDELRDAPDWSYPSRAFCGPAGSTVNSSGSSGFCESAGLLRRTMLAQANHCYLSIPVASASGSQKVARHICCCRASCPPSHCLDYGSSGAHISLATRKVVVEKAPCALISHRNRSHLHEHPVAMWGFGEFQGRLTNDLIALPQPKPDRTSSSQSRSRAVMIRHPVSPQMAVRGSASLSSTGSDSARERALITRTRSSNHFRLFTLNLAGPSGDLCGRISNVRVQRTPRWKRQRPLMAPGNALFHELKKRDGATPLPVELDLSGRDSRGLIGLRIAKQGSGRPPDVFSKQPLSSLDVPS